MKSLLKKMGIISDALAGNIWTLVLYFQNALNSWKKDVEQKIETCHQIVRASLWLIGLIIHKFIFIGARRAVKGNGKKGDPYFKVSLFERFHIWIVGVWGAKFDWNSGAFGWIWQECDDTAGCINDAIGSKFIKVFISAPKQKIWKELK